MKTFSLSLMLVLCLILSGHTQSIDRNTIRFDFIQKPLKPLNKSIRNYQVKLIPQYEADQGNAQNSYQQQLAKADADFQAALRQHDLRQQQADNQYAQQVDAYNHKSASDKAYVQGQPNQGMPQRVIVPLPQKVTPPRPFMSKTPNLPQLTAMINLEGYTNAPDNAALITITIMSYEMQQNLVKTDFTTTENGKTVTEPRFHYEIASRQPLGLKIETPDGGVALQQFPPAMSANSKVNTNDFKTQTELDAWWTSNRDVFLGNNQQSLIDNNMRAMNVIINDNCGFCKKIHETDLILVTSRKADYKDYQDAYDACLKGYNMLASSKTEAINNILAAISIWETALRESNPNDKKARINADVTIWTLINLGEAYAWIDSFGKANECIDKLHKMDLGHKERKHLERLEPVIKNLQASYDANK